MVAPSLWQSITGRLLLPIAALALLLAGLIGYVFVANYHDFDRERSALAERRMSAARASLADKLTQAQNIAHLVARLPEIVDAMDARDLRVIVDAVTPFVDFTDLDLLTVYDRDGIVVARGDAPAVFGRKDALAVWLTGLYSHPEETAPATVAWVGDRLMLVSAAPLATVNQAVAGQVVAGFAIDRHLLDGLKLRGTVDLLVAYEGQPVAATLALDALAKEELQRLPVPLDGLLPATGFSLSVLIDDSAERAQFRRRLSIVMVVLGLSASLVTGASILITLHFVTHPLDRITAAMIALAQGERGVVIPGGERVDEIGAMARAAEVFKRAMAESIELTQARERERLEKERAQTEAAAEAETRRQVQEIVTASPVALLLCRGAPPRIELANQAAHALLGGSDRGLIGTPVFELLADGGDRRRLETVFSATGRVNRLDVRLQSRSGGRVWGAVSARSVGRDGGQALLLGIEDITQRKHSEDELRTAKEQAEQALAQLTRTQESLIQAEKMASLSLLVAGVAHEINTPLGIGVTSASLLADKTAALRQTFESGQLKRADLSAYVAVALETVGLMLTNLGRAAELVHSFKQVAVDQTSAERRRFDLHSYIDECLMSLRPRLKLSRHQVVVDCPNGIMLDSYPGALAQILTNLVINSLLHAYEEGQTGILSITVADQDAAVVLRYADNGRGIPKNHLGRIFEPFFTTKRGAGGTGLGLHVVYNLATQTLKGDIAVDSEEGHGTTFTLHVPKTA
ncbi:MAG: PAS domain S-box protein [Azospirillum sp.]|nr:PAS domain S-box protein [Azospirillum sp.]